MPSPKFKYIRTEPPALLANDFLLVVDEHVRERLNAYRQAAHAFCIAPVGSPECARLEAEMNSAALQLAGVLSASVKEKMGEPDDWAAA